MTMAETETRLPFYMRGNYAPVGDEVEAFDTSLSPERACRSCGDPTRVRGSDSSIVATSG